jgi:hypothetical protein
VNGGGVGKPVRAPDPAGSRAEQVRAALLSPAALLWLVGVVYAAALALTVYDPAWPLRGHCPLGRLLTLAAREIA